MHVSVFSIVKAISVVLGQATGAKSVSISSVIAKLNPIASNRKASDLMNRNIHVYFVWIAPTMFSDYIVLPMYAWQTEWRVASFGSRSPRECGASLRQL